jgi:cytochrome c-type biogenesis protein CcmH
VTTDAEAAFAAALEADPRNFAARYYLGLAYAQRQDNARALSLWNSLLADAPANAPWRAELLDRIALLTSHSGSAPNVAGMVDQLAARLKAQPDDPEGWQRLIRSYAVLGDARKAREALGQARAALAADGPAQSRLALEARELKLEK